MKTGNDFCYQWNRACSCDLEWFAEWIGSFLTGSRSVVDNQEEERVVVSKKLLSKLKKTPQIGLLCKKMELLNTQLIKFANQSTSEDKDKGKDKAASRNLSVPSELASLNDYEDVAVPTIIMDVHCDGVYDRLVGIVNFERNFELVGGVNAPKKIACLCTDGRRRPMLLKGIFNLYLWSSLIVLP